MEAMINNLVWLSRQRLKEFLSAERFDDNNPNKLSPSLSEIDFDPSYLLSLLLKQIKIPFLRVRLSLSHFDMQIVSDKGDVINTVLCSYQDDCAILECIDNREIPDCIQDLLLHPKARQIFWNGLVFVEICNKNGTENDSVLPYKVTTVLKCSTNMLLCYAENAYKVVNQGDNEAKSRLKTEQNLLLALHPDLDLEVSNTNNDTANLSNSTNYRPLQLSKPKNYKYRHRAASQTRIPHVVEKLRKKFPIQNRRIRQINSSDQLRNTKFRSLLEEPFCKVPENSAEILSKKWKDAHSLYRLKNPQSNSTCIGSDQNFPVDHIAKPQNKTPGFCVVPEEKHMIEAIASSHCAEIVVSRRSADNFYFGQLKVMSRQRVTNESLKSTTSAAVTSSPTRADSANSAANERLCEFELGSRQSVNKYIVEYLRMIADRDRTPKHSIANLRK